MDDLVNHYQGRVERQGGLSHCDLTGIIMGINDMPQRRIGASLLGCHAKHAMTNHTGVPMHEHEKLNYVEFASGDLSATKLFFQKAFNWSFTDHGPGYTAFSGQGLDGGFFKADMKSSTNHGAALLVFYSKDLEGTLAKVSSAGGTIVKPIFTFPGGRRFHFTEPAGNEFAVWSDA